jgi:hypothetical protein
MENPMKIKKIDTKNPAAVEPKQIVVKTAVKAGRMPGGGGTVCG